MTIQTSAQILTDLRASLLGIATNLNETVVQAQDALAKTSNNAFYGEEDSEHFSQYIAKLQDATTTIDGFVQLISAICIVNAGKPGPSNIVESTDETLAKLMKMGIAKPIRHQNLGKDGNGKPRADQERLDTLLAEIPTMNDGRLSALRKMHKDEPEILQIINDAATKRGNRSPMKEMMDSLFFINQKT